MDGATSPALVWPEKPTCHEGAPFAGVGGEMSWRERGGLRCCSYCGSLHPADLLAILAQGATLYGADWKYGHPHKFYISGANNPLAIKWYNAHLLDEGYSPDAKTAILAALTKHSGIEWIDASGRGVTYSAPYHGYQKTGYRAE